MRNIRCKFDSHYNASKTFCKSGELKKDWRTAKLKNYRNDKTKEKLKDRIHTEEKIEIRTRSLMMSELQETKTKRLRDLEHKVKSKGKR